jgi:hypothetical protein
MSCAATPITKPSNATIVRMVTVKSLPLSAFCVLPSDVFINSSVSKRKVVPSSIPFGFGDTLDITTAVG